MCWLCSDDPIQSKPNSPVLDDSAEPNEVVWGKIWNWNCPIVNINHLAEHPVPADAKDYCTCSNCETMATVQESFCCQSTKYLKLGGN